MMSNLILNRFHRYANNFLFTIYNYIFIVSAVLKQLKYPFKFLEIENLDNFPINHGISKTKTTDESNQIKLLIQCYLNEVPLKKKKLSKCKNIFKFMILLYLNSTFPCSWGDYRNVSEFHIGKR